MLVPANELTVGQIFEKTWAATGVRKFYCIRKVTNYTKRGEVSFLVHGSRVSIVYKVDELVKVAA
jgi:hypothetical protein